jgi:hypothetical protein
MIVFKIAALFFIAATYFLVVYILEVEEFNKEVALMPEQTIAYRRLNKMHLVSFYARELAVSPLEHSAFRPIDPMKMAAELERQVRELHEFNDGLLFGSAALGIGGAIKRLPARDVLEFENACPHLPQSKVALIDARPVTETCEEFADGLLKTGLVACLTEFLHDATLVREKLMPLYADVNATRVSETLAGPTFSMMDAMDSSYLRYALIVDSNMFLTELTDRADQFTKMREVILAVFLVIVVLSYMTVYDPLVYSLDRDLKRVRGLLVMIPLDIIESTASLRNLLVATK